MQTLLQEKKRELAQLLWEVARCLSMVPFIRYLFKWPEVTELKINMVTVSSRGSDLT